MDETPSGADGTKILLAVAFAVGLIVLVCGALYLFRSGRTSRRDAEDLRRDVESILASPTPAP